MKGRKQEDETRTERGMGQLACREKLHGQTWRYLHQLINNDTRGEDMELPTTGNQYKDTKETHEMHGHCNKE